MDPRPCRAGGVAVALLVAVALAPASPASAQVRSSLQLDDLCWMGPNRPIVRARNLGDQPVPYTMRSVPAMRSGTLAEATRLHGRCDALGDGTLGDSAQADHDRAADDWASAGAAPLRGQRPLPRRRTGPGAVVGGCGLGHRAHRRLRAAPLQLCGAAGPAVVRRRRRGDAGPVGPARGGDLEQLARPAGV